MPLIRMALSHTTNFTGGVVVRASNASRGLVDVRFKPAAPQRVVGHDKGDVRLLAVYVRFTLNSGHSQRTRQCPLIAKSCRSAKANIAPVNGPSLKRIGWRWAEQIPEPSKGGFQTRPSMSLAGLATYPARVTSPVTGVPLRMLSNIGEPFSDAALISARVASSASVSTSTS